MVQFPVCHSGEGRNPGFSSEREQYFIGIDVGGTNIQSGVVDVDGHILNRKSALTLVNEGQDRVIERLCGFIRDFLESFPEGSIKGIGIGSAGVIDIDNGLIITSPNFPDWKDVPLRDIVSKRFGIATILDNDANAAVFGEYWSGSGRGVSSLVGLTLGTGVGGGIVIDGRIWHGCEGMAGEIGHMTIVPDGLMCACGNQGCLEAYASATAIVKRTIDRLHNLPTKSSTFNLAGAEVSACQTSYCNLANQEGTFNKTSCFNLTGAENAFGLTSYKIYRAALAGDVFAKEIFRETGIYLGLALASIINILNPEMIVIAGGVSKAWDFFSPSLMVEIKKRAFAKPAERVRVVPARLGNDGGLIGAGILAARALGF